MSLGAGPSIILGGNGLGKTTIVQAVVYALAGGVTDAIESERSKRWGHTFFQNRLEMESDELPHVEIDFSFESEIFSVRRYFANATAMCFRRKQAEEWIENPSDARDAYEKILRDHGGFLSPDDFAFLVHRLIYLPESRESLAWDVDAQTRIFMLLNQDVMREEDFRKRRDQLRNLDSEKRHTKVALNKVIKQLEQQKGARNARATSSFSGEEKADSEDTLQSLIAQLTELLSRRRPLDTNKNRISSALNEISLAIETLREELEGEEAALIDGVLAAHEKELALALHKLTENGICPACGTLQMTLRTIAHQHLVEHKCVICGSQKPHEGSPRIETLRSQLSEKMRAQRELESELTSVEEQIRVVVRVEDDLQRRINDARRLSSNLAFMERGLLDINKRNLPKLKAQLEEEEADLARQIQVKQAGLERDFTEYRQAIEDRVVRLKELYTTYATAFLGVECELIEFETRELFQFKYFIPSFANQPRYEPESCSEAQRFFLDIAYRLALIDYAQEGARAKGTFICETPENALDLSYVDNVVAMFLQFSDRGNNLLLTANIQTESLAKKLLSNVRGSRQKRVLNLLEIGQLSDVQKKSIEILARLANEITGAVR
jgi:DNA repair exonuclease SbcCD ATPase subunit